MADRDDREEVRRRDRRDDEDDDDRPRRRRRDEEDDEDDRPRSRGRRRDEDEDDDRDERRPRKKQDTSADLEGEPPFLAMLLLATAGSVAVFIVVNALYSYFWWKGVAEHGLNIGGFFLVRFEFGSPVSHLVSTLVIGLILFGPCAVFLYIGANKLKRLKDYGFALAAAIIAASVGAMLAILCLREAASLAFQMVTPFQFVQVLFTALLGALGLFAGIRGLVFLNKPGVKKAFFVKPARRSGGRRRGGYDDDDY